MGTLVALYKPFDLSLQYLTLKPKYKYLLYISFFCFVFGFYCALLPKDLRGVCYSKGCQKFKLKIKADGDDIVVTVSCNYMRCLIEDCILISGF